MVKALLTNWLYMNKRTFGVEKVILDKLIFTLGIF